MNRLDEPIFMAVSKPLLTEFGNYHKFETCDTSTRCFKLHGANQNKSLMSFFVASLPWWEETESGVLTRGPVTKKVTQAVVVGGPGVVEVKPILPLTLAAAAVSSFGIVVSVLFF